ncbi:hypothetical protein D1872_258310 [compost metagenome]
MASLVLSRIITGSKKYGILVLIRMAFATSNECGSSPKRFTSSGSTRMRPLVISDAMTRSLPGGRSPKVRMPLARSNSRTQCSSASPEYSPFFNQIRAAGPTHFTLNRGERCSKLTNGVSRISSFISSPVYPAAMRAATIAPEEVPANRLNTTPFCSAARTAPASEIPFIPPP